MVNHLHIKYYNIPAASNIKLCNSVFFIKGFNKSLPGPNIANSTKSAEWSIPDQPTEV